MLELARSLVTNAQFASMGELRVVKTPENPQIFRDLLNSLTDAGVDGNT